MCTPGVIAEQQSKDRAKGRVAYVVGPGGTTGNRNTVDQRERGAAESRRATVLGGAGSEESDTTKKTLLGR